MIIMKKFFSALLVVLFATNVMAQTGLTCNDPIPVDSNYVGQVDGPCTLWYVAYTYDLPLTVHFIPEGNNSTWGPEVEVDLTCTPGVYDDPKVHNLVTMVEEFDITFPIEFLCDKVVDGDKVEWDLSVSKTYRDQLASFGVTYNVPAYVKVTFFEAGTVRLKPDTLFKNCMESADEMNLGDTIEVLPNDTDRVFMVPMTDWKNDSIQFVWNGENPIAIYFATTRCAFVPESTDPSVWASYEVYPNVPFKLQSSYMKDAVDKHQEGGVYYGKVMANDSGKLVVENIPMSPIQGNAVLLEYGQPIQLKANDNTLFCFPKSWTATQFIASTKSQVKLYASNTPEFSASDDSDNLLAVYAFNKFDATSELYLSSLEMSKITNKAADDYIYVRFQSSLSLTITPDIWDASDCAGNSILVTSQTFSVPAKSSSTIYRLLYDDWKGYDMSIKWMGSSDMQVYIADTCYFFLSSTASELVQYSKISKRTTKTILATDIESWAARVDGDGYLYIRLNSNNQGNITFTSSKPIKEDSPCVLASTLLEPKAELVLNLDKAFDIYRIDYQAWLASGVKLVWTGASLLHTFVAKDCEFAVAIYHKDVVNYTEVPAEGNVILSKDILATLGQYVDEDGYLYVRFLTEYEGALTTQLAE